jgi:L-threonylcarbamoyladenylate synthase
MNIIKQAVDELLLGNIVALPTDTVYGLAVDIGNIEAVNKLYSLKQRPLNKPSSIAVAHPQEIGYWVKEISQDAQKLIDAFWPGPLTLILPAASHVPYAVNAGYPSIGLRCSASEILREVILLLGRPLCLTSANPAGERAAMRAQEVRHYFHNDLFLIEKDDVVTGKASTIIDLSQHPYCILREDAISRENIQAATGLPSEVWR